MNISATLPVKLAALREHKSQMGDWDPAEMLAAWAREQGKPRGLDAAEAYRMVASGERYREALPGIGIRLEQGRDGYVRRLLASAEDLGK